MELRRTLILPGIVLLGLTGCLGDEKSQLFEDEKPTTDNRPPTISGSPASLIVINDQYRFEPNASDPDGDSLTFSVSNRPNWASFNSSTGELSGRPTLGDVGSYNNIRISTSDGESTAELSAFSIDVTQGGDGSVSLSWSCADRKRRRLHTGRSCWLPNLLRYRIRQLQPSGGNRQSQFDYLCSR